MMVGSTWREHIAAKARIRFELILAVVRLEAWANLSRLWRCEWLERFIRTFRSARSRGSNRYWTQDLSCHPCEKGDLRVDQKMCARVCKSKLRSSHIVDDFLKLLRVANMLGDKIMSVLTTSYSFRPRKCFNPFSTHFTTSRSLGHVTHLNVEWSPRSELNEASGEIWEPSWIVLVRSHVAVILMRSPMDESIDKHGFPYKWDCIVLRHHLWYCWGSHSVYPFGPWSCTRMPSGYWQVPSRKKQPMTCSKSSHISSTTI